jgi:hypothetical protein
MGLWIHYRSKELHSLCTPKPVRGPALTPLLREIRACLSIKGSYAPDAKDLPI